MGQKAITIYTPEGTAAHIAAEDDAFIFRSLLGAESGIVGSLSCVKVDDNTVRLSGGGVSNRGYSRIDTVAAVFTKGGGEVADTHTFAVVKGTPVTGTPSAPALTSSALLSTGHVNQTAVFYVRITGSEITSVSRAAAQLPAASSAPKVFVQQAQPSSPSVGDLWLW